jgi:hypothetical protein
MRVNEVSGKLAIPFPIAYFTKKERITSKSIIGAFFLVVSQCRNAGFENAKSLTIRQTNTFDF